MSPCLPGYWMNETSGVLRPAVEAYLRHETMTCEQVAAMRAYLRQWIDAPGWTGPNAQFLRQSIDDVTSQPAISSWLAIAAEEGIDPL